ncbi:MAG: SAM-dependent methyltransferase [Bacteroidetes bacterium HGW-Bacteroidetes-13]|nr:MAG: SAM-dependent methyltransferase [Bacteroidetes bacterium HGW-Bacteroidetes-13]
MPLAYLLDKAVQAFIENHLSDDPKQLALKGIPFKNIPVSKIIDQIIGRKTAKAKFHTEFDRAGILFPPKIHLEQTSSEQTANYKASLVSGTSLIDLTGGFGIDAYSFSKKIDRVIHCEKNTELSEIVLHNLSQLRLANIECLPLDGIAFLKENDVFFDWIFIDPSRRDTQKRKVFLMEDCEPDISSNIDLLFSKTDQILIKTSPLLDISSGIRTLQSASEIHVVAVDNEVKELLWVLKKNNAISPKITTVNLKKNLTQSFSFIWHEEMTASVDYSPVKKYLYEPNAAIMKSGGFKLFAKLYSLEKLHSNTHLYTSDDLKSIPGRCFKVLETFPFDKKIIKEKLSYQKANISIRNFKMSVEEIRKKFGISDGGDAYVFFVTNCLNKPEVLICEKITI